MENFEIELKSGISTKSMEQNWEPRNKYSQMCPAYFWLWWKINSMEETYIIQKSPQNGSWS